jgi:hypothetical protein
MRESALEFMLFILSDTYVTNITTLRLPSLIDLISGCAFRQVRLTPVSLLGFVKEFSVRDFMILSVSGRSAITYFGS